MKILITGGVGFLGSHMVDKLIEQGNHVTVLDNFQTGTLDNLLHLFTKEYIQEQKQNNNSTPVVDKPWVGEHVTVMSADVIDISVDESAKGDKTLNVVSGVGTGALTQEQWRSFDQIYHMACAASPPHYQMDPIHTMKTCVVGTLNMLQLAHVCDARILYTSTSEVYGDPEQHPQKETYRGCVNCNGIRSNYDEGKRAGETLCFDMHRTRGVQIRVARIFNTYGPRMNVTDGRVISNFVSQAIVGKPLTVYGEGEQTRSFCYVSDLILALNGLMNQNETTGPVNCGNPDEYTIIQMAKIIKDNVGTKDVEIIHKPLPKDDPTKRKPDITLAKKYMGWEPKVSLEEGLKLTIKDFRERIEKIEDTKNLYKLLE